MTTNRTKFLLLAAAGTLALGACGKKAPPELPPAPLNQGNGYDDVSQSYDPNANQPGYGSNVPGAPCSQENSVASVSVDRVFLQTDDYPIGAQDAASFERQVQ